MSRNITPRNPRATYRRQAIALRRIGGEGPCACGESRLSAFIPGSVPTICATCDRKRLKRAKRDNHHVFGRANSPLTVSVPVNDHRAFFNTAQHQWPPGTLQNPSGNPLLGAAAFIRGFVDLILYLIDEFLIPVAEMLEHLGTTKGTNCRGTRKHTKLKSFEPK